MPGSVIPVTGLLNGPVGAISQTDFPLISPRKVRLSDTLNINYGDPVILNPTNDYSSVAQLILLAGSLTPLTPLGIAKDTVQTNPYYPLGGGTNMAAGFYNPGTDANVLTRGTINVAINYGVPVGAGSGVYIRTALNAAVPLGLVGGFEGAVDPNPQATTGTASINTTALTVASGTGIKIGQVVTGVGVAPNTTVTAVTGTAVTLSIAVTAALSATAVSFANSVLYPNIVFKTGVLSTDPVTAQVTAQVTILERLMA